jgi:hypothetical protein
MQKIDGLPDSAFAGRADAQFRRRFFLVLVLLPLRATKGRQRRFSGQVKKSTEAMTMATKRSSKAITLRICDASQFQNGNENGS